MIPPWRTRRRCVARALERGFAFLGVLFVIFHAGFHVSRIASGSMAPTLQGTSATNGDLVLTETISYRLRRPRRWEVVLYRDDEIGVQVMKRVVGLPGESVSIRDDGLRVDGKAAGRPASLDGVRYFAYGNLTKGAAVQCGHGYYVLGDDSRDSQDSRFDGPVAGDRIIGRPWLVVWPPSRLRFVNP
jgi:signal peptidase I